MGASDLVAESVWEAIGSTRSVTDDQLSILHFIYGKNFEKATRICDQKGIKRISGEPSGRFIFQPRVVKGYDFQGVNPKFRSPSGAYVVVGESRRKEEYLCFGEHYCACYSFFYDIINRGEELCCKHQLAARLAASTGTCIEVKVCDEELAFLLADL